MSGAVEGVDIGTTLAAADYLISLYERLWKGGAVRDLAEAIGTYDRLKLAALTTPPARTYAEGVSGEALFRAFMASDVTRLTTTALPEEWPHMMPSYRAAWEDLAIRLLSQGGGKA